MHPKAKRFSDFRRVYDEANRFDAVVVSTPEHTHAAAALPALQLGKHIYLEKPLSYNVHEARVLREAAAKAGVATQMGTQIHASENYRRVVELIKSGAIGPVTEAHVWVSRAWGRQSPEDAEKNRDIVSVLERPSEWYRWWDFGNGTMSDLGSHWNDLPFWALDLKAPLTIEAFGPPPHPEIAPASMKAVYEYGSRGDQPPVTLSWYQGTAKPDLWNDGTIPQWGNGHLFIGEKGMLLSDYGKYLLLPEEKFEGYTGPEPFLTRPSSHHAEWIDACKTGAPTGSNFEYAGWLTEANHLGNVAYRVGHKIEWDAEAMRVTNASEAEPFLRRDYREGWSLG
jgi:predicted dehydrogenase